MFWRWTEEGGRERREKEKEDHQLIAAYLLASSPFSSSFLSLSLSLSLRFSGALNFYPESCKNISHSSNTVQDTTSKQSTRNKDQELKTQDGRVREHSPSSTSRSHVCSLPKCPRDTCTLYTDHASQGRWSLGPAHQDPRR